MGEGRTDEPRANQRLTVAQAATALGITEGAVRSRIKRGTLPIAKEGASVFVLLGGGTSQANQKQGDDVPVDHDLVVELRDRVRYLERYLERQVEEERESRRRADTLLARLMDRVPELETPPDERDAAETVEQAPEGAEPRSDTPGRQEGAHRRPWWRRVFER